MRRQLPVCFTAGRALCNDARMVHPLFTGVPSRCVTACCRAHLGSSNNGKQRVRSSKHRHPSGIIPSYVLQLPCRQNTTCPAPPPGPEGTRDVFTWTRLCRLEARISLKDKVPPGSKRPVLGGPSHCRLDGHRLRLRAESSPLIQDPLRDGAGQHGEPRQLIANLPHWNRDANG